MAGTASIDARHGENEHWGPHVFLTASGDAEAVRDECPADLELALRVDRLIYDAQAAPPSYSSFPLDAATHRADWVKTLGAHDIGYFVAERAGEPVGHATWRVTNLAASRFWPARGFRLTHIRLVRRLPEL